MVAHLTKEQRQLALRLECQGLVDTADRAAPGDLVSFLRGEGDE